MHVIELNFVSWQICFLHSQPSFCSAGHFLCSFGCSLFNTVLVSLITQILTVKATLTSTMAL